MVGEAILSGLASGQAIDGNTGSDIATVSFKCTVCGKCCNTAPLMSVPELFRHENLFVGCLAIRRISRRKTGEILAIQAAQHTVSAADVQLLTEMAADQLFNPGTLNSGGDYDFSIMTQAMDYESLQKCPALGADYHCAIQNAGKPAVCTMVPFDSLYPDSLQNIVLMSRDFAESCIVQGLRDDYPVVVRDGQVADRQYRQALKHRRDDLGMEKLCWGDAVFEMLRNEGFCHPAAAVKIPLDHGLVSLSIIPVLLAIAGLSEKCAARCLQYADSQIKLIDSKINQAISRKSAADKQTTQEFRVFRETYLKFRPQLLAAQTAAKSFPAETGSQSRVEAMEMYLGV